MLDLQQFSVNSAKFRFDIRFSQFLLRSGIKFKIFFFYNDRSEDHKVNLIQQIFYKEIFSGYFCDHLFNSANFQFDSASLSFIFILIRVRTLIEHNFEFDSVNFRFNYRFNSANYYFDSANFNSILISIQQILNLITFSIKFIRISIPKIEIWL